MNRRRSQRAWPSIQRVSGWEWLVWGVGATVMCGLAMLGAIDLFTGVCY